MWQAQRVESSGRVFSALLSTRYLGRDGEILSGPSKPELIGDHATFRWVYLSDFIESPTQNWHFSANFVIIFEAAVAAKESGNTGNKKKNGGGDDTR